MFHYYSSLLLLLLLVASTSKAQPSSSNKPPNILFFLTDDQDVTHQSLEYMPRLHRLFRQQGTEFPHYYVPTGLCCPSRTTILRGQYCHNTKIYDNGDLTNQTYQSGAWQKYLEEGLEQETLATRLQQAGYETALVGKYMNGYDTASHVPPGFDHWMGMMSMQYYGPKFSDNGQPLQLNQTVYQTDFIRDWAVDFLQHKRNKNKPFFLMVTPYAPHAPATPAKRHEQLFNDAKFPRYDSFNPPDDIQHQRPAWIQHMPPLTQTQIDHMDHFYRNRLRALQAVDEALETLVETLEQLGESDNTYFFYSSDNGQHFGDHRVPAGKRQAFESDVLVPLLVRGPKVPPSVQVTQVVQSVDLGPTFLDLAAATPTSYPMDGKSMLPLLHQGKPSNNFRWAALLEMYGGSSNIGLEYKNMKHYYYQNHMFPNTYQAVRVVNGPWDVDANWLYVEWCTGEQEFFNMTQDPHQVHNQVDTTDPKLIHRLSKLLAQLGDCRGRDCYELDNIEFEEVEVAATSRSLQGKEHPRFPCFNPVNWNQKVDVELGRKPFAVGLPVPEPFQFGFPFSDGDLVPDELLEIWQQYEHYFY